MKLTSLVGYTSWCAQIAEYATTLRLRPTPPGQLYELRSWVLRVVGVSGLPRSSRNTGVASNG